MTGRSDSDKIEPDRGNTSGRLMFGAALIFAVLATLTLVFTTNAQWLKLAVIAALWAAFFGAMLSVKYRHQAAARAGEVADLQAVYELELEREVAARREYELEVEADTRRRIAEETEGSNREDVAALRAELHALRENLERLTGGEVLVERIALRAQSTRMRTLGEPSLAARAIAAENERRSITAGSTINAGPTITAGPAASAPHVPARAVGRTVGAVLDPSTELFEPAPMPRQPQRADSSQRIDMPPRDPSPRVAAAHDPSQRDAAQRDPSQRDTGRQATTRPVGTQRPEGSRPDGQRPDNQRSGAQRLDSQRSDSQRSDGQRLDPQRPDGRRLDAQRPDSQRGDAPRSGERRPGPARVPTPQTGEQSRNNMRHEPINPPLPRQSGNAGAYPAPSTRSVPGNSGAFAMPGNSGAYPVQGNSGAYAVPGNSGAYPVAGNSGSYPGPGQSVDADSASGPTRYAEPVARPAGVPPIAAVQVAGPPSTAGARGPGAGAPGEGVGGAHRGSTHRGPAHGDTGRVDSGYRPTPSAPLAEAGQGGRRRADERRADSARHGDQRHDEPSVGDQHPDSQYRDSQRPGDHRPSDQRPDDRARDGEPLQVRRDGSRRGPAQPYGGQMPSHDGSRYDEPGFDASDFESGLEAEYNGGSFAQGGRHGSGSYEPVSRPAAMSAASVPAYASAGARSGGRRAQAEPAGAHTAGRSVTELLAAHSSTEDSPRRHRRRAD
jgi:hypothetical protein